MTSPAASAPYRERLTPGPWMFVILLLILPAVTLAVMPISPAFAFPTAILIYLIIAATLMLLAPTILIQDGRLTVGRATIAISLLGSIQLLDDAALRAAIGPGTDARSYLMVRGYIHTGLKIAIEDPADPTPWWIFTSRRPEALAAAIEAARAA